MKFTEQVIKGVYLVEPEPYQDERGMLRRHFCQKEFKAHNLMTDIRQCNISENKLKHTLRGFHYQLPPHGEDKLISCINGEIYDIVVDIRRDSLTYLNWLSFNLSKLNRKSLYVPVGCANAWLTMEDDTQIHYYHSEFYTPNSEGSIRYNDPTFGFEWPSKPSMISEKDLNIPDFQPNDLSSHF